MIVEYLYIGGLHNGSDRVDFMTNPQTGKYAILMALQNDAAKNILWRSSTRITPRFDGPGTQQNKGKSPMTPQTFNRPQPNHFGQS